MSLQLSQTQQQALSPQVLQRIEMLQMNSLELVEYIEQLALENPLIELQTQTITKQNDEIIEQYQWIQRNRSKIYEKSLQDREDTRDNNEQSCTDSPLSTDLLEQVGTYDLSKESLKLFCLLLEHLGEDGRLEWDICERFNGYSKKEIEKSLFLLQSLNPAGVGARSLKECLTLQLNRLQPSASNRLAISIVNDHLDSLAKCHYGLIAKKIGARTLEIEEAIALIKNLNPHPCNHYINHANVPYIVPDLTIEWEENGFLVTTNDSYLPSIQFSTTYCNLLSSTYDQ